MLRRIALNLGVTALGLWAVLGLALNVRHLQWRHTGDRWAGPAAGRSSPR